MGDETHAMPSVLIVMGVSGAGKSTIAEALAQRLGWRFADADGFHPAANVAKMSAGYPLTDDDRWPWLRAIAEEIDRVAAAGSHAVIACSALKRAYRDVLLHGRGDVRLVYLDGDRQLIGARLALRHDHFMPPGLLDSQFGTLEVPHADEQPIVVAIDRPVEAMVDDILARLPGHTRKLVE
ncbi:gluconokinase [Rhodopseudomonas rhenobacensis]|uniref:Gluconokinase n=1 Tax=Rhodopseudomonas rhenobacensis TaxID=87461 RepID=A0A7W7Z582_9BRAD|nr:gluconokinase [Rhodopseudomonas rhenobacensis]MBB5048247.1 gluconokinase [Rhodopseudomonas rhenobacensis]